MSQKRKQKSKTSKNSQQELISVEGVEEFFFLKSLVNYVLLVLASYVE